VASIKKLQKDKSIEKQRLDLQIIDSEIEHSETGWKSLKAGNPGSDSRDEVASMYIEMNRKLRDKIKELLTTISTVIDKSKSIRKKEVEKGKTGTTYMQDGGDDP